MRILVCKKCGNMVAELKKVSKPVESQKAIAQVATVSSADEEIGQ